MATIFRIPCEGIGFESQSAIPVASLFICPNLRSALEYRCPEAKDFVRRLRFEPGSRAWNTRVHLITNASSERLIVHLFAAHEDTKAFSKNNTFVVKDPITRGATSYANEDVGELSIYIRQGNQESLIWKLTEQDLGNGWHFSRAFINRIQGDFEILFQATR